MPAFGSNPFINVRPVPRYQPRPVTSGLNPFNEGMINARPDIPRGRPNQWGNSTPWEKTPSQQINVTPTESGQIVPANSNPGLSNNKIPSNAGVSSIDKPNYSNPNNYPNKPLETWNINPQHASGRPNKIPTIDVPVKPVNEPKVWVENPMDNDPLGNPIGKIGKWAGENFGKAIKDNWIKKEPKSLPLSAVPEAPPELIDKKMPDPKPGGKKGHSVGAPQGTVKVKVTVVSVQKVVANREFWATPGDIGQQIGEAKYEYAEEVVLDLEITNFTSLVEITRPAEVYSGWQSDYTRYVQDQRQYKQWAIEASHVTGFGVVKDSEGLWRIKPEFAYAITISTSPSNLINTTYFDHKVTVFCQIESKPTPEPWLRYILDIPQETTEEEMPCQPCQAAQCLRAMQRTITVDSTTIVPIPTGDLVVTTTPKVERVFALPGTEQSIKNQFDLLAEIKKRTAHAFNQARRAKMMTRLLQIMNVTDFFLNLHNAMMISADIGETFFDAIFFVIDNVPKLLDELPFAKDFIDAGEWAGFDSKKLVTEKFDEMGKQAFGVQNWADAKAKWAAFNQIVRSANTVLLNMKDLRDSQGDLAQMAASRIAKVNNALVKSGVLTEDGDLMTETVNRRSAFLDKLEKIEESGVVNTAVFFQSLTAGALDVQETKKELQESREEFQKSITDGTKVLTDGASASKTASQGADSTRNDAKPSE